MSTRCPDCGYVRTADQDAPAFHKPGCKTRRRLQGEARKSVNLKTYQGSPRVTIGGDIQAKLDDSGRIIAAVSFDGLRWKSA